MSGKVFILLGDSGAGKSFAAKYIFGARNARPGISARNVTTKQEEYKNEQGDTIVDCVGYDHSKKPPALHAFRFQQRCFIVLLRSPQTDDKLKSIAKQLSVQLKNLNAYFGYKCAWGVEPDDALYRGVGPFEKLAEDYREGKLKFVKPQRQKPNCIANMSVVQPLPSQELSKVVVQGPVQPPSNQLLLWERGLFPPATPTIRLSSAELNLDGYNLTFLLKGMESLSLDEVRENRAVGETVLKLHLQVLKQRGLPVDIETAMRNNEMRGFMKAHGLEDLAKGIYNNQTDSDEKIADVLEAIFGAFAFSHKEKSQRMRKDARAVFSNFLAAYTHWCFHHKVSDRINIGKHPPPTSHNKVSGLPAKDRSRSISVLSEPRASTKSSKERKPNTEIQICGNSTKVSTSNKSTNSEIQSHGKSTLSISINPTQTKKEKATTQISISNKSTQTEKARKDNQSDCDEKIVDVLEATSAFFEKEMTKRKRQIRKAGLLDFLEDYVYWHKVTDRVNIGNQPLSTSGNDKSGLAKKRSRSASSEPGTSDEPSKRRKPKTKMQVCGNST